MKPPSEKIGPIIEDYSDIGDGDELEEKLADFKVFEPTPLSLTSSLLSQSKSSLRKGIFHPDQIRTVGLGPVEPSPSSAPLLSEKSKAKRPGLAPLASSSSSHSRASSMSGSFGRSELRRTLSSSSDLERYTEAENEDYEDVFVKPNGTGMGISILNYRR